MSALTTPLHPQRTDRDDELRWHLPPGVLPASWRPDRDDELSALLDDGTLSQVRAEPGCVVTRLHPGRSWRTDGARVRTALHAALHAAVSGAGCPPAAPGDDPLRVAAEHLITGRIGELARSHGGRIDLVGVRDGVVEVALDGACHGCPAAATTLHLHLENQLRALHPGLRAVRPVHPLRPGDDGPGRRRRLPLLPRNTHGLEPTPTTADDA